MHFDVDMFTKNYMPDHIKIHTGERAHKCKECGKVKTAFCLNKASIFTYNPFWSFIEFYYEKGFNTSHDVPYRAPTSNLRHLRKSISDH